MEFLKVVVDIAGTEVVREHVRLNEFVTAPHEFDVAVDESDVQTVGAVVVVGVGPVVA